MERKAGKTICPLRQKTGILWQHSSVSVLNAGLEDIDRESTIRFQFCSMFFQKSNSPGRICIEFSYSGDAER